MRPLGQSGRSGTSGSLLRRSGYAALLGAQFLGALNDNLFKMIVSLLAVSAGIGAGGASAYLSLAGVVFMLPYVLFSGYAGHVADVLDKRTVLVAAKSVELVVMALALGALVLGRLDCLIAVLFLLAAQATFLSPAKYGILPEILHESELSRANGLLESSRFAAIILGTVLGGALLTVWSGRPAAIGALLLAIAASGALVMRKVARVPRSGAQRPLRLNPWHEIASGLRHLVRDKEIGPIVCGLACFESLASFVMLDLILVAKEIMGVDDLHVGLLGAATGIGTAVGSYAAGRLSRDRVELGLVPFGAVGTGAALLALAFSARSHPQTALAAGLMGVMAGFYFVPLNAALQQRAGQEEKGRLIATSNFLGTTGVLLSSAALWLFRDVAEIPPDGIILMSALFTLAFSAVALWRRPCYAARALLWGLANVACPTMVRGRANIPAHGPVVLVCRSRNLLDVLLVCASVDRAMRPVLETRPSGWPAVRWLLRLMEAIELGRSEAGTGRAAVEAVRVGLGQGQALCVLAPRRSEDGDGIDWDNLITEALRRQAQVPLIQACVGLLRGANEVEHADSTERRRIGYRVSVSFRAPDDVFAPEQWAPESGIWPADGRICCASLG